MLSRGRGSSGGDDGNGRNGRNGDNSDGSGRNGDNSDGSGRNGVDWEVEWIEETNSEETMLAAVELGVGVTVEDI
jgi:hypothetical protein